MDISYIRLADALNALANGFSRTKTGSEIRLLKYMYSQKEADLACELTGEFEEPKAIASRLNKLPKEVSAGLLSLLREGKVWISREGGKTKFRLAPFIVGSYEAHVKHMSRELALLVEEYLNDGGVEGIMKPQPAIHRVIPVPDAADLEWILPYDNVLAIIDNAKSFHVQDCICRLQKDSIGKGCDAPKHNCLSFSTVERALRPGDITKEDALKLLKEAEDAGLIHSVSNVVDGLHYICNCCGCCCGILRGITEWGIENTMARANYEAIATEDDCSGCRVCIDRCQVSAIEMIDDVAKIDRNKCLGCGLCVTTCQTDAIKLLSRPQDEQVKPPADFGQWERDRLKNRGML